MLDFSNAPLDQSPPPPQQRHNPAQINQRLIDTLESWLPKLLPGARRFPSEFRAGSVNGERGSSLSIARTGPKRGLWQDRASGQSGDPIALIQAALNTDFVTAIETAADIARLPLRKTPASQLDIRSSAENLAAAIRIIEQSILLTSDTLAHQYLVSTRGLTISAPQDLRFHPRLYHAPSRQSHPALVAIVRHHSGRIVGTHRTYLDPDTCDKIKIDPSRLALGPIAGGAVWLSRAPGALPSTLAVCEGIETGLAALTLFPSIQTVAATLSTSGLRNFEVPPSTARLLILADFDPVDPRTGNRPGTFAAETLQHRLTIECAILYPDRPFKDFNDQLLQNTP